MKLWMRFLLGCAIGAVLGLSLPERGGDTALVFEEISQVFIRVARFALFPLVFFNAVTAIVQLREDQKLGGTMVRTLYLLVIAAIISVALGTLLVLVLTPQPIPLFIQEGEFVTLPTFGEVLRQVFPANLFQVLVGSGNALLPILILAILLGVVAAGDDRSAGPFLDFIDSTGRVMYRLNALVMEVLAVGLIALTTSRAFALRGVTDFELFSQLIVILSIIAAALGFVVLPALYFLITRKRGNPFVWLYAMVPPALAGLITGDGYVASASIIRVARNNLGVSRGIEAPVVPLLAIFGHAGSAMVIGGAFVLIVQSYTALEIAFGQILWIMGSAVLVSFFLGSVPGGGVLAGLSWLSSAYQQGMEEVYLILQPILPVLISIGVFLDIMIAGFIVSIVAEREGERTTVLVSDFV